MCTGGKEVIIDLWMLSKSDTCLLVPNHPTQIVVTRPDDVDQDDDHDEEDDKKTTTSPRSSSANNIYKMHQEIDNDNFISSTVRNSCSCRKCQRKCSLFDFDCDAKEAKTVMKYLRFRKVFSRRDLSQLWRVFYQVLYFVALFRYIIIIRISDYLIDVFYITVQTDAQQRIKPLFWVQIRQPDFRIHLQYFLR